MAAMAAAVAAAGAAMAAAGVRGPWPLIAAAAGVLAVIGTLACVRHWRDAQQRLQLLQRRGEALAGERDQLQRAVQQQGVLEQELLRAKQAAEAAALAKGEFLATMSHEIRTPLNGILPMLDLIARGQLGNDQRQMLQTATVSSQQLLRIVDDILDYSRLEAKGLDLEITTFNLRELLEGLVQLMQRSAEPKGLKLSLELDPAVRLSVRGDPVRLRQVLGNLLVNAIKFTERGQIRVRVLRQGETSAQHQLRFEVIDSGIGIDDALQSRLFQSFSQADASTTRLYGGTGLGLAICKRIIDLMHGRIGVSSTRGRGATFWFEIPLLKVIGDLPAMAGTTRALLVSEDSLLVQRLERVLQHHDIRLHSVDNASAALDILRAPQRPGIEPELAWVIADTDALRHGATALHRAVLHDGRQPAPQLLWLQGRDALPPLLLDAARQLPRDAADSELHTLLRPAMASARPAPLLAELDAAVDSEEAAPLGLRLLLVEDNSVNLLVAQRLLQVLGCEVVTATDGEQALQRLRAQRFDLVLMDCQMPVLDGYQATGQWRAHEAAVGARRLPIVAMTANAMAGDRERCLQAGMDDYLSKPVNRSSLLACLQRWQGAAALAVDGPLPAPELEAGLASDDGSPDNPLPVLDASVLDELFEVIGTETARIIGVFLDDTPPLIRQLQDASIAADLDQLRALAHSLKSASANVGATALSVAARRIEHDARAGTLERPAVAVALLIAEFARARIALAGYQAGLHAPLQG
ncbi:ATP-binding protein [Stenotrophomonas rhizophila]|uniref:ATP-binding protein n=1 Tax=Stenotrophomonas rhizophila TaxID=216778 RepID=UPI001E3A8AD1|nr:ATP-binding protein [Stenotrophomonas rhizophila]MCC7634251.1 response regulator [Stenotrophomonas rhizophila]MCC7663945.1 response regulator [Stenotrophomonas rhizophila]